MSTSDWTIAYAWAGSCDGGPGLSAGAAGAAEAPAAGAPAGGGGVGGGGDHVDDAGGAGGRERANAASSTLAASIAAFAESCTAAAADNFGTAEDAEATGAFRWRTVTALPDVIPSSTTGSVSDPDTSLGGNPALNCILKGFPGA